jgi:hypothetical protein
MAESPINAALRSFEAAEANLEKLERILAELLQLLPDGICFGSDPAYDELRRSYADVLSALPAIDGWKPEEHPIDLDELAQCRLDAQEIGEIEAQVSVERQLEAPGRELAEYRHHLHRKRRQLIREALIDAMAEAENVVVRLRSVLADAATSLEKVSPSLDQLRTGIQQIETMLGSSIARPRRWADLRRHLHFGQVGDLRDVVQHDWPAVSAGLSASLYDRNDPVTVDVSDLGELAASQPRGSVVVRLKWESLIPEGFERLVFSLISQTRGYENPAWLMRTQAADRGRDLSVTRVTEDLLGGVIRNRVIIQCKHWLAKSVRASDIAELKEQMKVWEPPRVDILVVATSGRFTSDGVLLIEKHNQEDRALRIEMWPESHLERLLAERPALVAEFGLR